MASKAAAFSLLLLIVGVSADFAITPFTPHSKDVINRMSLVIRGHIQWNNWTEWSKVMRPLFAPDFTYDYVQPLGKTVGLWDWYNNEHLHYNEAFPNFTSFNFLFLGTQDSSSLQSYHVVRWAGEFGGVPAPPGKPLIKIKDMDFYTMKNDQIFYNWCMVDVIGILQQGGYKVLPPAPMPNGNDYLAPRAMEGIPAPDDEYATEEDAARSRVVVTAALQEDLVQQSLSATWWTDDLMWCGPAGIGHARSREDYVEHFLKPLHAAFSNPELSVNKFVCEGNYCGVHFYLRATHTGTWLGQPATGRIVQLRFGTHFRVVLGASGDDRIADGWTQVDVVDVFSQMGVDLMARAKAQYPALLEEFESGKKGDRLELHGGDMAARTSALISSEVQAGTLSQIAATMQVKAFNGALFLAIAFSLGVMCTVVMAYRARTRPQASSYNLLA